MRISRLGRLGVLALLGLLSDTTLTPAAANAPPSAPVSAPVRKAASHLVKRFVRQQTRESVVGPGFSTIDTNNDGYLSFEELQAAQLMTWPTIEQAERARKVFGIISLEDFFREHDTNGGSRMFWMRCLTHVLQLR